ncbi:glutathione S-transferase N-terminal domain-containing protein [Flexibacterium corallicola]|uniref:glutathione S-transferase N-terminal domain-containing protein n=1 Tax=Flexibacterium corallicola TaxID=3037259 RepID=UPI00286F45DA|nr:glutathione S-transferase N-terminal domain-containing protein [Pseudovibrio sp. M1P-2-3]
MKIILYAAEGSNSSERVEWALCHKAIAYERVEVAPEELKTSYLTINPFGYVPAISLDGEIICESLAIIECLEELFPKRPLLPYDPIKRAKVRQVCEYVNSTIHPAQNRSVLSFLRPELYQRHLFLTRDEDSQIT